MHSHWTNFVFNTYFNIQMTNKEWKWCAVKLHIWCGLVMNMVSSLSQILLLRYLSHKMHGRVSMSTVRVHTMKQQILSFFFITCNIARFYNGRYFSRFYLPSAFGYTIHKVEGKKTTFSIYVWQLLSSFNAYGAKWTMLDANVE